MVTDDSRTTNHQEEKSKRKQTKKQAKPNGKDQDEESNWKEGIEVKKSGRTSTQEKIVSRKAQPGEKNQESDEDIDNVHEKRNSKPSLRPTRKEAKVTERELEETDKNHHEEGNDHSMTENTIEENDQSEVGWVEEPATRENGKSRTIQDNNGPKGKAGQENSASMSRKSDAESKDLDTNRPEGSYRNGERTHEPREQQRRGDYQGRYSENKGYQQRQPYRPSEDQWRSNDQQPNRRPMEPRHYEQRNEFNRSRYTYDREPVNGGRYEGRPYQREMMPRNSSFVKDSFNREPYGRGGEMQRREPYPRYVLPAYRNGDDQRQGHDYRHYTPRRPDDSYRDSYAEDSFKRRRYNEPDDYSTNIKRTERPYYNDRYGGRYSHDEFRSQMRDTYRKHIPENPPPSDSLGLFRLSYHTTQEQIEQFLNESIPNIKFRDLHLVKNRETNRSKGYAFVYFDSIEECCAAKEALDGKILNDKEIKVDFSISNVTGPNTLNNQPRNEAY